MVDASDLSSDGLESSCGFDSRPEHQLRKHMDDWKECEEHKEFIWCPYGNYYECTECGLAFSEQEIKEKEK